MPDHHDETLLERYQREHRVYEGMNMSKAEELASFFDMFKSSSHTLADKTPLHIAAAAELRRLSAINAELLEALKAMKHKLRLDDPLDMYDSVCAAIAKAQGGE